MMNGIIYTFRFLRRHFLKIVAVFWLTVIFFAILFPINDLNDLITSQISKLTNRKVFVQFDEMRLNPFGPKLTLEKIFVETSGLPAISANLISLNPSISSAITRQPEGVLIAEGFLKGDVQVSIKSAGKSEAGNPKSKVDIQAKGLSLKEVRELASLPVSLLGKLNLNSSATADLSFQEQPEGEVTVSVAQFEMPSTTISAGGLPFLLPGLKLAEVEMKGRLSGGKFLIESGKFGKPNDDLFGTIKGDMGLTFLNTNGVITPILGSYNFDIDLTANPNFYSRTKTLIDFLISNESLKTPTADGGLQLRLKLRANAFGLVPQFAPLR